MKRKLNLEEDQSNRFGLDWHFTYVILQFYDNIFVKISKILKKRSCTDHSRMVVPRMFTYMVKYFSCEFVCIFLALCSHHSAEVWRGREATKLNLGNDHCLASLVQELAKPKFLANQKASKSHLKESCNYLYQQGNPKTTLALTEGSEEVSCELLTLQEMRSYCCIIGRNLYIISY